MVRSKKKKRTPFLGQGRLEVGNAKSSGGRERKGTERVRGDPAGEDTVDDMEAKKGISLLF